MPRMKAPTGGMVVNQNYQEGGQFLAKALKNIRSTAEKLVKLARPSDERTHDALLHAVRENQTDSGARLAFADFLQEQGQPGAHVVAEHGRTLQTTGAHPRRPMPESIAHNVNVRTGYHPVVHLNDGKAFVSPAGLGIVPDQEHSPLAQFQYYGSASAKGTPPVVGALPVMLAVAHRTPESAENAMVNHSVLSTVPVRNVADFLKYTADFPPAARKALLKQFVKHLPPDQRKVKLARPESERKTLPGSPFTGAEVGHSEERPLTIRELRAVEDSHGIAKDKRLSARVKPDDESLGEESTFRANKDHVAPFINELTKKRLVGHELRSRLADPSASDAKKMAYLIGHLATEAREFTDATQANGSPEWYGSHVDAYEHAIHNAFGIKPGSPEMTIVKALTAATSSSTNPRTNAMAVYRMIRAGAKINPKNPLLGIPAYDRDTLTKFREDAHKANGKPIPEPGFVDVRAGHAPHGAAKWYTDHVLPHKDLKENIGYRSRPAVIVDHPGSPDHGKLVEYQDNGEWIETPQAGGLYNKYRKTGKLKTVDIPDPDASGALRPKGWNARPSQVDNKLQQIQHLIKKYGADGARDWLLSEHTLEEFKKEFNYKPAVNQLGVETVKGEKIKIPGMFVLGPKFGAFALNLHGNHPTDAGKHAKWLTADMWWSRTWNRMMGTLFTGAPTDKNGKPTKEVDIPRGPKERRWMTEAAQGAAKAAGLRNVAELQAVIWYYEQSLWRMLGVKQAKSYSFLDGAGAITAAHARDTGNGDLKDIAKRYNAILDKVAIPGKWTKEQRKNAMLDFLRTTAMDGQNDTAANRSAAEAKVNAVKLARVEKAPVRSGLQALDTLAAKLKAEGRMPSRAVIVQAILSQMPQHQNPEGVTVRLARPNEQHEHVLYVSPSTREGSTFDQAVAGFNSPDMVALAEAAKLQPTVRHVEPALGMWSDGAEESNVVHVGDPTHLLPIAQKLGKAFKQKAVLTFRSEDNGPDRRHVLTVPEQDPKAIDTLARHYGIEFKTMIRKPNGTRVEIVDMGGTLGPQVEEFAKASGATNHRVVPGTSNFVETA